MDLDFFSESDELGEKNRNEILGSLVDPSLQVIESVSGNLFLLAGGVRVGFFGYGYALFGITVSRGPRNGNIYNRHASDLFPKCKRVIGLR